MVVDDNEETAAVVDSSSSIFFPLFFSRNCEPTGKSEFFGKSELGCIRFWSMVGALQECHLRRPFGNLIVQILS